MGQPDVLVINAGSSSLKIGRRPSGHAMVVERLDAAPSWRGDLDDGAPPPPPNVEGAVHACLHAMGRRLPLASLEAVAHRVVHGGERFTRPTLIDDAALAVLEGLVELAPLHLPANLAALRAARAALPGVPHVAIFDTAFHATLPPRAYRYAVPEAWYRDHGVRRYGFHGPSHDGVSRRAAELLGRPRGDLRIVTLHLGNGASAAAVQHDRSVDTSMGLTTLDGLVMGTRSGSLDPGVLLHLLRRGMPLDRLHGDLHHASGLLGLSGLSNDVRDLRSAAAAGHEAAGLALEVFAYRARTVLGALAFAMGGLDAVVFTGGIGEHDPETRAAIVSGLEPFGIALDADANLEHGPRIDASGARVALLVVPTDEEGMMAEGAGALVRGSVAS